jgi:predicted TIM-barrel fold metal-dependent hydrolase
MAIAIRRESSAALWKVVCSGIQSTICALALAPLAMIGSQIAPIADHHQHMFSPAVAAMITRDSSAKGISARDIIDLLDSARIRRALLLSVAYTWGSPSRTIANEYEKVKAENDWQSQQVALYPDRLRVFCSFNPLKPYAMQELARCSRDSRLRRGLKLHFGNSDVDLDNPSDVAQVRKVFKAANDLRMPIVVHMHTSIDRHRSYGRAQALVFVREILSAAPKVPVQIAHLAGAGDYDDATDGALSVFVDAIARHDARAKNLWFDVTSVVLAGISPEKARLVASRIRQIGVRRVVYGSDAHFGNNPAPREGWAVFQQLPLTQKEFRTIAQNLAPYMRW